MGDLRHLLEIFLRKISIRCDHTQGGVKRRVPYLYRDSELLLDRSSLDPFGRIDKVKTTLRFSRTRQDSIRSRMIDVSKGIDHNEGSDEQSRGPFNTGSANTSLHCPFYPKKFSHGGPGTDTNTAFLDIF